MDKHEQTCLVCGKEADGRRGLCSADYQKFIRSRKQLPEAARDEFDRACVEAGKILPAEPGRRTGSKNPFADELQQVAESLSGYSSAQKAAEIAAQMPAANITTPEQESAADSAAAEDERIAKDRGTPVGRKKKQAKKKPPVEANKKGKPKRKKSG